MTESDVLAILHELAGHVKDMNELDGAILARLGQVEDNVRALSNRVEALTQAVTTEHREALVKATSTDWLEHKRRGG